MIQLLKGSIFDTKCDLIVIPCNNMGGITSTILKQLVINNLPYYNKAIETGDVSFVEVLGGFSNASVIGYAASVNVYDSSSSEEIIRTISHRIKIHCIERSLQKVNIPLLGTGAGKLSAKDSYKILKEEFESIQSIQLCIYAYSEEMYDELAEEKKQLANNLIKNPRVFISYTGVDIANRNWVKDLACRLRKSGVDARIDIFHLKPGQDLPQWMTNELLMADKVLLICDKHYAEKADNRKGGVGWETMIIQGDMLSKQDQNKYIAVLRDKDIDHSLPIYVKSRYALNWSDNAQVDNEFDELLLYLFDCDIEPPLGKIPEFIMEKAKK